MPKSSNEKRKNAHNNATSFEEKLKYAVDNGDAKIEKKTIGNRKGLRNVVTIDGKSYQYNPQKISKALTAKLKKITKTNQFEATQEIKKIYQNFRLKKALRSYAITKKAVITDEVSAFESYVNSYSISNIKMTGLKGLSYLKYQYEKLKPFLTKHPSMKILIVVSIRLLHLDDPDEVKEVQVRSRRYEVHNTTDLEDVLNNMANDIQLLITLKQLEKSNLKIDHISKITLHYDRYNPTRGGSYIELPKYIADKKACINIKNTDNECFKHSVQCGFYKMYEKDHPERITHYKKIQNDIINWEGVKYPTGNRDIDRFEEANNGLISVNTYHEFDYDGQSSIAIHRRTKVVNAKYHISLLKIDNDEGKSHYVYIKDYDKLIGRQTNKHKSKIYHCRYCQHGYKNQWLLNKHLERGCLAVEGQSVKLPEEGDNEIYFKNSDRALKAPYVIYSDFECLTEKIKDANSTDSTKKYQNHTPTGFQITVVDDKQNITENVLYRGNDCMEVFCKKIGELEKQIMEKVTSCVDMEISSEDQQQFDNATHCYLCKKEIKPNDKKGCKVRDHCHLTGAYRGCAHKHCNLTYNYRRFKIPVFFHNLKNYDAHLIISNAHQFEKKTKINVIAQNSEKFITFGFNHVLFKDSFSFLSSSLEKLTKLNKYKEIDTDVFEKIDNWEKNFNLSKQSRWVKNTEDLHLLTEKGVYPYDYMNTWDKFNEKQLPEKKEFYSLLSGTNISDDDYERAQNVWNHFDVKDMGEYHDLYLQTDVLLLADVFENFRIMCMNYYGLDPAHYYTLPNFAWDAMLKKTNVTLEQLTDLDMYEMVERGLRGGMCQVSHKHVKANNKYMDNYVEDIISSYIAYLDANNLYGDAMSQPLPFSNFEWSDEIQTAEDVLDYNENDIIDEFEGLPVTHGFILEVDLEYPKELHDLHSDYPLAPENRCVSADMVSDFSKGIYKLYHSGKDVKDEKTKKLVLSVNDKKNYVVHIRNLQYYLKSGLKLTKVHRCLQFEQCAWLKPWIDFNTQKRKEATNDFEKDLFKLMNNAVFGKTMEDVRSHMDFEIVDNIKRLEKCLNNPIMKNRHFINDTLVGIEKMKPVVLLNKPIYVGMSILDLSKLHMYKFYYDVLKTKYNEKIKLAYTDTDSFVIHVETEDLYKDLKQIGSYMDFSDYPKNHDNYDNTNKKVLGKFKDEVNGKIIREWISLVPKMYAGDIQDCKEKKTAKGVPKQIIKREFTFKKYKETLEETNSDNIKKVQFNSIRSYKHQIFSITCSKTGLSNYDNKRYYESNYVSYPHGHYRVKQLTNQ